MSQSNRMIQQLSEEKFLEMKNECYLVDTRAPEIFAHCYIKNSINIPGGGNFCGWAGMVVPHNQPIILIVEDEEIVLETIEQLSLVNIKNVIGYIIWDRTLSVEMDSLELLPAKQVPLEENMYILDVRTESEWNLGHIQTSHNQELSRFHEWLQLLPKNKKIATICGSGFRSSIAASILQKHGFQDVASIRGGMLAWKQANLPIRSEHY